LQNDIVYKDLYLTIKWYENENSRDFYLNIALSFVYLMNNYYQAAYKQLTNAIEINESFEKGYTFSPEINLDKNPNSIEEAKYSNLENTSLRTYLRTRESYILPYSLRALIPSEINPNNVEDATYTVLLNPTSRNYHVLANTLRQSQSKSELKKAIIFYGKAIELRPDFACAYNKRALTYQKIERHKNAIDDFKKCIELDKTHCSFLSLLECLILKNEFSEVIEYANLELKIQPENIEYQKMLGIAYKNLNDHESASEHFKRYLLEKPDDLDVVSDLSYSKYKIDEKIASEAISHYY